MRSVALNKGVFKDQRLKLRGGHDNIKIGHLLCHGSHLGMMLAVEIAADAVFELFGLAHIDDLAMLVQHQVDPRQQGELIRLFPQGLQPIHHAASFFFSPSTHQRVMVPMTTAPPIRAKVPGFSPKNSSTHRGFSSGSSAASREQASAGQLADASA